jgi:hypothetical protein
MSPAEHRHTGRNADGRATVNIIKHGTAGSEAVEVGRIDEVVAVAAGHVRAVLIRVNIKEVRAVRLVHVALQLLSSFV